MEYFSIKVNYSLLACLTTLGKIRIALVLNLFKILKNFVLQENIKLTKKEEDDIVKNLLQVDCIDDPALEVDFDRSPVIFPGGELFVLC